MAKPKDDTDAVANNLSQDPHRVREGSEKVLEVAIGREVRSFRRQQGITVADLANLTGLSIGMLSKIENGNTSPSLTTLQLLANALSVPITSFFRRFEETREAVHTKSGAGVETERAGTRRGISISFWPSWRQCLRRDGGALHDHPDRGVGCLPDLPA